MMLQLRIKSTLKIIQGCSQIRFMVCVRRKSRGTSVYMMLSINTKIGQIKKNLSRQDYLRPHNDLESYLYDLNLRTVKRKGCRNNRVLI